MTTPVLQVQELVTRFHTGEGTVHAVNGLTYDLAPGEALGMVGESGCGKSVGALSLMGLVPRPGRVESGRVILDGGDVLALSEREWRAVRGRKIAMVFQDPMTSLNPVLTVGDQITEALRAHLGMTARQALDEAERLLRLVGIPNAGSRLKDHPHQFSGGQRQRVVLAMALSCRPSVLIADEPTTALDVTIQAQIVRLVKELQAQLGMAIVWITHDLALVAGVVDRVAVMYGGRIVEEAPVRELYRAPRHPYTVGLLESLPSRGGEGRGRLAVIPGRPPDLLEPVRACAFAPRCPWAEDACRQGIPAFEEVAPGHRVACRRWREVGGGGFHARGKDRG